MVFAKELASKVGKSVIASNRQLAKVEEPSAHSHVDVSLECAKSDCGDLKTEGGNCLAHLILKVSDTPLTNEPHKENA